MKYSCIVVFGFIGLLVQNSFAQSNRNTPQIEHIDTKKQVIDERVVTFVGTERLKIIQNADSVLVYELNPDDSLRRQSSEFLEGFFIIKRPRKLINAEKSAIESTIIQAKTYDFKGVYQLCAFSPTIAFEFYFQGKTVRLLLCFFCNDLMFFDANGRTSGKSFEKSRNELKLLVNRILNPKKNRSK